MVYICNSSLCHLNLHNWREQKKWAQCITWETCVSMTFKRIYCFFTVCYILINHCTNPISDILTQSNTCLQMFYGSWLSLMGFMGFYCQAHLRKLGGAVTVSIQCRYSRCNPLSALAFQGVYRLTLIMNISQLF